MCNKILYTLQFIFFIYIIINIIKKNFFDNYNINKLIDF